MSSVCGINCLSLGSALLNICRDFSADMYGVVKPSRFAVRFVLLSLILTGYAQPAWSAVSVGITTSDGTHSRDGTFTITLTHSYSTTIESRTLYQRAQSSSGAWGSWTTATLSSDTVTQTKSNGFYQYYARVCRRYVTGLINYNPVFTTECGNSATLSMAVTRTPGTPGTVSFSPSSLGCTSNYTVSWGAASGANRYRLMRRQRLSGGSWTSWSTLTSDTTSRSYSQSSLYSGYDYQYRVDSYYTAGGKNSYWSGYRDSTAIRKPYCAPSTVIAPTASSTSVLTTDSYIISWGAASGTAATYELQEQFNSGSWSTTQNTSARSKQFSGRSKGQYCYRVRARNVDASAAFSGTRCVTVKYPTPGIPGKPAISNATPLTIDTYTVAWAAATGVVSTYELQEQFNGGSWVTSQNTSAVSQSFSQRMRGQYCYRVRARNVDSVSAFTSAQCATISLPVPSVSLNLTGASLVGSQTYDSGWNGVYTLQWSVSGYALNSVTLDTDGVVESLAANLSGQRSFDQPENMGPGDKTYRYFIKACNADGCSTTPAISVVVRPYPIPSPPDGFHDNATASQSQSYTLGWSAPSEWSTVPSGTPTWYLIKRGTQVQQLPGSQLSLSYTGQYGQTYQHQIKACTVDTQSNHCSNYTSAHPVYIRYPAPGVPGAPTLNPSVAFVYDDVTVSWSTASGHVSSYELQEQRDGGAWITRQDSSARQFTTNKSLPGQYCYRVRARNVDASSAYSAVKCLQINIFFADVVWSASADTASFSLSTVVTLSCDCSSGQQLRYRLNGGVWRDYRKPIVLDRTTLVETRIEDRGYFGPIHAQTYTRTTGVN